MREQARNFGLLSGRCFKNIQGGMRGSWINKCGAEGRGVSRRDTSECPQHRARDLGTSTQGCRGGTRPRTQLGGTPVLRREEEGSASKGRWGRARGRPGVSGPRNQVQTVFREAGRDQPHQVLLTD